MTVKQFFRIAKRYPPGDDEYLTNADKQGPPSATLPDDVRRSWNALSAYDSEEGARRQAQRFPRLGAKIVRYDIPEGAAITWEKTFGPGHYDLRGDIDSLRSYLAEVEIDV